MGIYAAVAVPVQDSGNIDLFVAFFFEAYYLLPYNETSFEFPPSVDRSFGRRSIYESIQAKLESRGYPGKNCVLKAICEAASYTTLHANGIVGDLMHLLFTPSASEERNDSYFFEYREAEVTGWEQQNCEKYNDCQLNLFDFSNFIK
ncbi:unnamed protein product [Ceutorhynchus assimilis]|uniref:Uncharacterized protein n=1 Tax=Ceutorhynchus assimilis TaxID=467358 RepID=A0A9P0GKI5_9CUCU|nr:unnamed protein product [Ceutorhynchus assimilis]